MALQSSVFGFQELPSQIYSVMKNLGEIGIK